MFESHSLEPMRDAHGLFSLIVYRAIHFYFGSTGNCESLVALNVQILEYVDEMQAKVIIILFIINFR